MDISGPCTHIVRSLIAGETIVFECLPIMMQMNEALDIGRRRERRALSAEGDDTLVGRSTGGPTLARTSPIDVPSSSSSCAA